MENRNESGSGDFVLNASIVVAALLVYAKTADVFAFFAPPFLSQVVGGDVSYIYGAVSALLIEGIMLALHFNRRAHGYPPAETTKWTLLAISLLCQVFDGFLTSGAMAQQSDTLRLIFQYLVPSLPILVIVLLFAIRHLPEVGESGWRGLSSYLPNWHYIWQGGGQAASKPVKPVQTDNQAGLQDVNSLALRTKSGNWQSFKHQLAHDDLKYIATGNEKSLMHTLGQSKRTVRRWKEYARRELKERGGGVLQ